MSTTRTNPPDNRSPLEVCAHLIQAIARMDRLDHIYDAALDTLAEGLRVDRAAVLLFDPDGVMRFKAWRGLSDSYREAVEGHTPWAVNVKGAGPIVVANVEHDPSLRPYRQTLDAERIKAMTFIPLEGVDGVLGKFMLYYGEATELSPVELQLAQVIAAQIAFAVERTQAQEAAKANHDRLRYALDAADMGTWDWDLRTESVRWSENMERIHGLVPGTFDGTFASYDREIHPEDREQVYASIRRALAGGVPHEVEYRIVAPDGTFRWVEGKGRVEPGPEGEPARMTGVCMNVTRRKEAELARVDALEQSNRASQRLAAIVASSDDAIVSKDLNGVIMSWNGAAERMFGYPEGEAIGKSITIIVPLDRRHEEDHVLARIRAGHPVEMETVRVHRSGRSIDISLKVSPVKDAEGRIVGASKIARDITARKQDEATRAELHRRLTLLVEASASLLNSPEAESVRSATLALAQQLLVADGYAVWMSETDRPGWRITASHGISAAFSRRVIASHRGSAAPTTAIFSEPLAVSEVSDQPLVDEQLAAYQDEGIRSMLVCPMRIGAGRGGTLVFYYRSPQVFREIDVQTGQTLANLAAAALTTADLYEEQRAQREAAESSQQRATFLADAAIVMSRSLDYEQTLASVARHAVPLIADWCAVDIVDEAGQLKRLAVAAVDPEKLEYARILQERYPPDPESRGGVHEVLRTGAPAMMANIPPELLAASARDEEHRRILGELGLTSYMCVPLVSTSGAIGAITLVFAESGRHYTDRDLAFAQDLAARAALAIDNAVSYRHAYEANRLKDEFLATLSHELRTPLNAILGYAQMLNIGLLQGERQSQAMAVLTRNAESLRQIIEDVLDVSRITSGKLRLNIARADLADIVNRAAATLQVAADAKGVALDIPTGAKITLVLGDADRLQQIVWNLLSNAVKFTPSGGRVQIALAEVGSTVQMVVSDNGRGIEPAFLPHIFERFRQADSRFSREHGGLGLGLAIVRELVELHGGTVTATSGGPGTGATFTVALPTMSAPRQVEKAPELLAASTGSALAHSLSGQLNGVRILAVDDEEDALSLLRVILESAGAEVSTAHSAEGALDLLKHKTFDALISDLSMPQTDGLELIRTIRASLPTPVNGIPAAALTAYARSEDRVAALASGFQVHIPKPVNAVDLVTGITAMLRRTASLR
jgi:PAS domain S-box-containing protein